MYIINSEMPPPLSQAIEEAYQDLAQGRGPTSGLPAQQRHRRDSEIFPLPASTLGAQRQRRKPLRGYKEILASKYAPTAPFTTA